jgi:Flp pilus assembly protein TadG
MTAVRRGFRKDTSGSILVEFAILAPIMVVLFLGTFEVTLAVRAKMKLNNAAQAFATMIAAQSSLTSATLTNLCNGAKMVMTPFSTATFKAAVSSVTKPAGSAVAADWHYTACGSATAISGPTTLAAALVPGDGDSVIIVQATYTYNSPLHYVLPASTTLTLTAFARPRQNTTISCPIATCPAG